MIENAFDALRRSWWEFSAVFQSLAPRVLSAIVIGAVGWLAAHLARWITRRVLSWLPIDAWSERFGLGDALRLAELPGASRLAAGAVFWLTWLVFLAQAIETLGLPGFEQARADMALFVVRLCRALVIFGIGIFASNVLWRVTLLSAFNAGLPSARLMAAAIRVLVMAIAVLTGLAQLGIPMVIVLTAFSIAFGAVMLGLALAFGLGGREAARELIARQGNARRPQHARSDQHL